MNSKPLVGTVFERNPSINVGGAATFAGSATNGFPQVQHRSKSVFGRTKAEQRKSASSPLRSQHTDNGDCGVDPTSSSSPPLPIATKPHPSDWRSQISEENQRRVEGMTDEERQQAISEIYEQLGSGARDVMQKIIAARKRTEVPSEPQDGAHQPHPPEILAPIPIVNERRDETRPRFPRSPPPALSTSSTRPSSRSERRLRFAELTPNDVHVYESAPPSPRKKILLLPPPDPSDDSVVSLGRLNNISNPLEQKEPTVVMTPVSSADPDPNEEEGTPEYIRRRFFPDAPANDPNLAWMESDPPSQSQDSDTSVRFDLTGAPIPLALASILPTHLGLHHHAEGKQAGYTLDDIFLLCRSTVPAQRTTMLSVLARIARRLASENGIPELKGQEIDLRKRILAAGLEAVGERGNVGVRAVEVVWQCLVGWNEHLSNVDGVELGDDTGSSGDIITSVLLEFFLPQAARLLAPMVLPLESQLQLLSILHRLAQESNVIASTIVTTPDLISAVIQTLLLTPMPVDANSLQPEPSVLKLLIILASASRENAVTLVGWADALLRFVTLVPPDTPYPTPLAISLLIHTLRFYTTLASYGVYAHIAVVVAAPLSPLRHFLTSSLSTGESNELFVAWTALLEVWTICATDPHKTTPSHDIIWSQVTSMAWSEDLLRWRESLIVANNRSEAWGALWQTQSALLEGARLNEINRGAKERQVVLGVINNGFESGPEKEIVVNALVSLRDQLHQLQSSWVTARLGDLAAHSGTLAAAIRLWLACISDTSGGPLASPPFPLPFPEISIICSQIVNHPLWSNLDAEDTDPYMAVWCRPLTTLLFAFLKLSKVLPGVSDELWIAQALSILSRSIPGDEDLALPTFERMMKSFNAEWMTLRGWHCPAVIWEKRGLDIIKPFLAYAIHSQDAFIAPLRPSPESILLSTTQRLPYGRSISLRPSLAGGLPLSRDWVLSPLDHLLRSGDSPVFRALPSSWDASETEVVRATLLLVKICQNILRSFTLTEFIMTREEVVFGCMKVFMLEHGQHENPKVEEVFRDGVIESLMNDILSLFTMSSNSLVLPSSTRTDLERVARRFLGPGVPFYQFYTDFVALYDGISFSHSQFARLLLPPTSMGYPSDYRKLLWDDFGHVLRTVRPSVDHVLANSIREYLWPIEQDLQIIRAYLRALVKHSLSNFPRLLAIHHIACCIWPDLQQDHETPDEKGKNLLLAIVNMGNNETVREVVTYYQVQDGIALPPRCFEPDGPRKKLRLECVEKWGPQSLLERLSSLLSESM